MSHDIVERMRREASTVRERRVGAHRLARPENLPEFSEKLLGVKLYPNQLEWHDKLLKYPRLLIEAAVGHGKSTWLYPEIVQFICRGMMELSTGKSDQVPRILFVTGRADLAEDYGLRAQKGLLSERVQELYGVYGVGLGKPWNSMEFRLKGMPDDIKEPTWRASGPTGGIEGTRANFGILDDFVDLMNALSPADRNRTWKWYTTTFIARLDEGARRVVIGSSWHPEDAYSKMRETGGYAAFKYPCYSPGEYKLPGEEKPTSFDYTWGELLCEQLKSQESLDEMRVDMTTPVFRLRCMMDHKAMMGRIFKDEWLEYLDAPPEGMEEYAGWDPATTAKEVADAKKTEPDYTAGVSMGFHPEDGKMVITDIFRERIEWGYEKPIKAQWERRQWRQAAVETNTFQKLIGYILREKAPELPVVGVKHFSQDKVQRLLDLLPYLERGFYLCKTIPRDMREAFLSEYMSFPRGEHDDILDAMEMALSLMKRSVVTGIEWDI